MKNKCVKCKKKPMKYNCAFMCKQCYKEADEKTKTSRK